LLMISTSIVDYESTYGDAETSLYVNYYPNLRIEKMKLGDGSTIYTVNDVVSAQSNLYKLIARNYHLPEDFVEGSAQAESGVAIKLRNQELQNERIGDIIRWRNVEQEIFRIERDILSRANIKLDEKIFIDFSESVEFLSPQEQREQDDWNLKHNLITPIDIARRQNKDLEEEQAQELIEKNKKANAKKAGLADLLSAEPNA